MSEGVGEDLPSRKVLHQQTFRRGYGVSVVEETRKTSSAVPDEAGLNCDLCHSHVSSPQR